MTLSSLLPPLTPVKELPQSLRDQGYAVLSAQDVAKIAHVDLEQLLSLNQFWEGLPRDPYLKDGGRYRFRRHSSFEMKGESLTIVPHRAHWQSVDYNALHGGIERWFEPSQAQLTNNPVWQSLLLGLANILSGVKQVNTWFVEAHQFRIDTTDGIGRPTPEGAHRDGVDFVAVFLLNRVGIKGGETRIFDANGSAGLRFTLSEPWSLLLMNDERMIHESTPIQPLGPHGYRDTLVLTFRSNGFQDSPGRSQQ
ncbi:2OG-Fe dioxygenase family protein [Polynucleobacter sp. AP-Jannik-300A-C4]|uniref:2OG-Fe dioxygenase family protein n=1 Tax=Polynucleobacter sp. AP-Jannik-300A-C4 TaxID=2576928 RepID=UPI001BFE591F|nr:2OG-Fe dioxygenase family protein [Polynucleobacter sp. AP-Jannik-300A-C4]QWE22191.1 2OG-Fe dioxygenase family protein [Polynucleobacter sp. AP-Jannik-300A-C4]